MGRQGSYRIVRPNNLNITFAPITDVNDRVIRNEGPGTC
jgi:hypothetical protein